jgi:hypothetical protein
MTPDPEVEPLGSFLDIDLVGPCPLSDSRDEFNGTIEVMLAQGLAVFSARGPGLPVAARTWGRGVAELLHEAR